MLCELYWICTLTNTVPTQLPYRTCKWKVKYLVVVSRFETFIVADRPRPNSLGEDTLGEIVP